MDLRYHLVDVFTNRLFGGNQLAVFTDGRGVPDDLMQGIARELNLSETTFVLPPDDPSNHFKVRIFTPGKELPMAGHPTVGTAYVLAREGMLGDLSGKSRLDVRFEEGVGVIPVRIEIENGKPRTATMTQPLPTFGEIVQSRGVLAEMLSLGADDIREDVPAQVVSCGVPFFVVPIASLDGMRRARVNFAAFEEVTQGLGLGEVFLFSEEVENNGSTVHSRMFAPDFGIMEDPATGGASGPLGSYLVRYGLVQAEPTAYIVSEQGIEMGRPSFIHITITQEDSQITLVQVGGECVYVGRGQLEVPAG
jgi:trans-2,3-dihydro-3-hydroxyanthranilate isomerase